jgi:hypothetical protein
MSRLYRPVEATLRDICGDLATAKAVEHREELRASLAEAIERLGAAISIPNARLINEMADKLRQLVGVDGEFPPQLAKEASEANAMRATARP